MLSNTMSLFGASPPPSAQKQEDPVETSPHDIPKDDLMHLCMKMNKRMHILENKIAGISKAGRRLLLERKLLVEYIRDITPTKLIEALPDPKGALSLQLLPKDDEVLAGTALFFTNSLRRVKSRECRTGAARQIFSSDISKLTYTIFQYL